MFVLEILVIKVFVEFVIYNLIFVRLKFLMVFECVSGSLLEIEFFIS